MAGIENHEDQPQDFEIGVHSREHADDFVNMAGEFGDGKLTAEVIPLEESEVYGPEGLGKVILRIKAIESELPQFVSYVEGMRSMRRQLENAAKENPTEEL